eukprot:scaffold15910_cov193-Amphora_coffeaeformis.AAC.2
MIAPTGFDMYSQRRLHLLPKRTVSYRTNELRTTTTRLLSTGRQSAFQQKSTKQECAKCFGRTDPQNNLKNHRICKGSVPIFFSNEVSLARVPYLGLGGATTHGQFGV